MITILTIATLAIAHTGSATWTPGAGLLHLMSAAGIRPRAGGFAAANPDQPGATGRAIVHGNASTIAGDRRATRMQQTAPLGA